MFTCDQEVEVFHAGTSQKEGKVITSGGRVLVVSAAASSVKEAVDLAYEGVKRISFEGAYYRKDIAYRYGDSSPNPSRCLTVPISALQAEAGPSRPGLTYASAGVSVDTGNAFVEAIKPFVKATRRPGSDATIGGFGGTFDLKPLGYQGPILVSGTDGVGTKLRVAIDSNIHRYVGESFEPDVLTYLIECLPTYCSRLGIDLVAMSVNDLIVQGAEPLYFLDYFACSHLDLQVSTEVVKSIAQGCLEAGCALVGGETAEMPGMYHDGS